MPMNHQPTAYLWGVLSLLGLPSAITHCAESDWQWLLRENPSLRNLPASDVEQRRELCRQTTVKRVATLQRRTLVSLAWIVSALVAAAVFLGLSGVSTCAVTRQHLLAAASIACFSWGILGRLGWREGSYDGGSVHEELDTMLFWLLYWLGSVFGVASLLNPVA